MIIGLTGGIASGKSTVSNILNKIGVKIVDADKISKKLSERKDIIKEIQEKISKDILDNENKLDRIKLKNIVFNNKEKLNILNEIFHPKIREEFKKIKLNSHKHDIIIFDIPLLFETGMYKLCDKNILVYIDKDIQIKRLILRDNITEELAEKIINSQMSLEEKKEKSDILINNDKTIEELEIKVMEIYNNLLKEIEK